jgi:pantetheine-phosphate adenylyltransferase
LPFICQAQLGYACRLSGEAPTAMHASMSVTGLYAGSFDPLTLGHLDVVQSACRMVGHLVVAIGVHHGKTPLFDAAERQAMIEAVCGPVAEAAGVKLAVTTFDGLVTAAAVQSGATLLIRGLRDGTDLDYEMQMAGMNARLEPRVQTVFIPGSPPVRPIAATLVRQIAAMGGDASPFVPPAVAERLKLRYLRS